MNRAVVRQRRSAETIGESRPVLTAGRNRRAATNREQCPARDREDLTGNEARVGVRREEDTGGGEFFGLRGTPERGLQDGPRRTSELKRSIPGIYRAHADKDIFRSLWPMASSQETIRKRFRPAFTTHSPRMEGPSAQ